ncbi:MAG: carbohydrate-binding family 9-like protein [Pirellulales bacterium]|nr:carbohydrate-binding family 9-like protein [Pirellulales bacterium]
MTISARGRIVALGVLLAAAKASCAAESADNFQPPQYSIQRTGAAPTIDGRLDEPAWFAAPAIAEFHFPWYERGEREQTVVKMLWDDQFLYVAHICQDAHITARHAEHDDPVAEDDCFEIMLAPDPDCPLHYFNVEWNVRGAYVDGRRPEGPQGPRPTWDVHGLRVAGAFVGSLNDDADRDAYWLGEVAIPLSNFKDVMPHMPPRPGDRWRLNFNRHGGDVNPQYSQWSPGDTPTPAFHTPQRFGAAVISDTASPFPPDKIAPSTSENQ